MHGNNCVGRVLFFEIKKHAVLQCQYAINRQACLAQFLLDVGRHGLVGMWIQGRPRTAFNFYPGFYVGIGFRRIETGVLNKQGRMVSIFFVFDDFALLEKLRTSGKIVFQTFETAFPATTMGSAHLFIG